MSDTNCTLCNAVFVPTEGTTGYGVTPENEKICFACCGKRDAENMQATGKATLYYDGTKVSNWPGTLTFVPYGVRKGRHNIARERIDLYFWDKFGRAWHGVQYGSNTQLIHCKRLQRPKKHRLVDFFVERGGKLIDETTTDAKIDFPGECSDDNWLDAMREAKERYGRKFVLNHYWRVINNNGYNLIIRKAL